MSAAVKEIREINNCGEDDLTDIAITIDGTCLEGANQNQNESLELCCLGPMPKRFICRPEFCGDSMCLGCGTF